MPTQRDWRWYDGQTATSFELWSLPASRMAYGYARDIALRRVHAGLRHQVLDPVELFV